MTRQPKVAIIGGGYISGVHQEAIRRVGGEIVGVMDATPAQSRALGEALGVDGYPSMDELLASPADVVHVTSPNHVHAEQAIAVLEAGKHVICEKPLATSLRDAHRMQAAAEASGKVNALCFNVRFYPMIHEARSLVAAGALGSVHLVSGSYLQDWLLLDTDWNWRLESGVGGELRSVADIGSHWIDSLLFVTGLSVRRVMARLHTVHPIRNRPVGEVETFSTKPITERTPAKVTSDDVSLVWFEFANGGLGSLTVSQASAGRKNDISFEINGTGASLAWNSQRPDELWMGHREQPSRLIRRDPAALSPSARSVTAYPAGHVEGFPDTFRGLLSKIYADIREGKPSASPEYPTFRDGVRNLELLEAIRLSNETGQWVSVGEGAR